MEKLLLRPTEAAEILGLGRAQVYAMCSRGELPCVKVGRRSVRLPADRLRAYVEELSRDQGVSDETPAGSRSNRASEPD